MLIDLRHDPAQAPQSAETLIIGSGAVGLTMAVELARAGREVTVLEAGGRNVDNESQSFFKNAQCREHQLQGLHIGRYRALGGTTNFWGGQLLQFDPIVFERRPWVAEASWPISRAELEPHYRRGYELLGMAHRLSADGVWQRMKVAPPALGEELELFFSLWAPEPNLAAHFKREITTAPNLRVVVNAPVVAIELDQARERVTGVVVRTADGAARRVAARRVVLANGTVEIARLLKLALADGRPAPWAGNRWLGKGFVDHIDCNGGTVTPIDRRRFHDLFDNAYFDRIKYVPKLKLVAAAQRARQVPAVAAHFLFNSSIQEHLGNLKLLARALFHGSTRRELMPSPRALLATLHVALPMAARYLRSRRMYNPADQGIQLRITAEQCPLEQSGIYLSDRCDALGMPIVEIDWRIDGREIEAMAAMAELVADYLHRNALARLDIDPALTARDSSFLRTGEDSYHHMGMARMATGPSEGVVDPDLKVFGTRNLYVAGAAVYPSTGFANPTLTAIALGLRLAGGIGADRVSA